MSARVYSALLSLYPSDLRHDFGQEMTQVFLDDLEDSRRMDGGRGVARVWWRSLKEMCRIAIPFGISKREIAVPLIMYVGQEIYLGAILLLGARAGGKTDIPKSPGEFVALALLPGLVPAFVGFVALCISDRSVPVPLNLSQR